MLTRGQREYLKYGEKIRARVKRYREANLELVRAKAKAYHQSPQRQKARRVYEYEKRYGLTEQQYNELFEKQDYRCAVCRISLGGIPQRQIQVDHEHLSERVRGILCHNCNVGLGHFKDNPQLLRLAALYLENS